MEYGGKIISVENEAQLKKEIKKIDVSDEAVQIMAPKGIFRIVKLHNVRNAVGNILKQEMLSAGGEVVVSQYTVNCAKERTDVLIMGTLKQFFRVIQKMKMQGWVLEKEKNLEYKNVAEEIEKVLKESV